MKWKTDDKGREMRKNVPQSYAYYHLGCGRHVTGGIHRGGSAVN